ncbi:MAG: cytochrome d ubiquinol oxidase subunit II [Myxococcota bacterium]
MLPDVLLASFLVIFLWVYTLSGGADFGCGVWDGLASGPRRHQQRQLIKTALGPIWEANHVWLIVVVVVMFACFPLAWSAITTTLFIPLTTMLLGIVLRGSAFVFRSHAGPYVEVRRQWSVLFAVASTVTPVMLGTCLAAVATGRIRMDVKTGKVTTNFFDAWLAPFPLAVGVMTLLLTSFLAAIYLAVEAREGALQDDFRQRGLMAGVLLGVVALGTLALARTGAPHLWQGLVHQPWSIPWQVGTGGVSVAALVLLWRRRFTVARVLAGAQTAGVVWGFGLAMRPYVVVPDVPLGVGMAPLSVQWSVTWVLLLGTPVLVPAFYALFRIFKGSRSASVA